MSTVIRGNSRRAPWASWDTATVPLSIAVLASRLVVVAGAVTGATLTNRAAGWQQDDPQHLTLKLGSLGNVLASAGVRWDSVHYLIIAAHGYRTPANAVFFPLYPLLIRAIAWAVSSYVIAGLLVSALAFVTALALLHRLVREELGDETANATVLLLAFSPVSLFLTALYTESLFLALALGALLLARRGRFGWASLVAAAATLTHIQGVLLIAPLVILCLEHHGSALRLRAPASQYGRAGLAVIPLLLPLLALAGFLFYLQSKGFGWLAPFSDQRYYGRQFMGPVTGAAQGLRAGISGIVQIVAAVVGGAHGGLPSNQQAFANVVSLAVLAICATSVVVAWRRLPRVYAIYAALAMLTCISSPAHGTPLTSLDRFALVLFPLWIAAAAWLQERRLMRATLVASTALLFVFAAEFARWVFIG